MKTTERREKILDILKNAEEAVSASALAAELDVSRQIIVGDIALLRASGESVTSTPRGYVIEKNDAPLKGITCSIVSCHKAEDMITELQICVDYGCSVLDVIVEHPVYGQLVGQLQLHSRYDIDQFAEKVKKHGAHALSELTDGVHIHTLSCPSQAAYQRVCSELRARGLLYED